jgi:hypothetical protein
LITLRQDAWQKLSMGLTTIDEVLRVTKSDEGIRQPARPTSNGLTPAVAELIAQS